MLQLVLPLEFPFDDLCVPYRVDLMRVPDLPQIMPIEQVAFPAPWPATAYRYELTRNDLSVYLVMRPRSPLVVAEHPNARHLLRRHGAVPVVGYGGFWNIVDEAHVSTLAIHPDWRGRGLGEMMLTSLIDAAILRGASEVTLEVRVSNVMAQRLYRKIGFVEVGRRKRYYRDNDEDALIMTTPCVKETAFGDEYARLKAVLRRRLATSRTEQ